MKILSAIRKLLIRDAVADTAAGYTEYFKNDPDSASRVYSDMDVIFTVLTYGEVLNRASAQTGLADFSREGYAFKEWNTQPDGSGTSYHGGETISNGTTLYAIWVEKTDVVALNHEGAKILYDDLRGHIDEKVDLPGVYDYKSAVPADVVEIYDAVPEKIKQMQIEIAPVQDLHGYDKPWVGGAGKNLCQSSVKSEEAFGLNITLNDDGSFKVTGTYNRNAATDFYDSTKPFALPAGTYTLSGTATNSLGIFLRVLSSSAVLVENAGNFTLSESATVTVRMYVPASASGTALPTGGLIFYPMIRLASITDATWEPYSNICQISGFTGCEIAVTGKNLFCPSYNTGVGKWANASGVEESNAGGYISPFIAIKDSCYVLSSETATDNRGFLFYDSNRNFISRVIGYSVDVPSDAVWMKAQIFKSGVTMATEIVKLYKVQVESGSVASAYEPFGNVYSIAWESAGTVYGGTLTVNADGTGTIAMDRAIVDENVFPSVSTSVSTGGLHYADYTGITSPANASAISNMLMLNNKTSGDTAWHSTIPCMQLTAENKVRIYGTFTTLAELKTQFTGLQIVYELATATAIPLTALQIRTILGYNRIYANTGSVLSMLYPAERYQTAEQTDKERIHAEVDGYSSVLSITDGADNVPMGMQIAIEPVQDLHTYEYPWPDGGGKNLADPEKLLICSMTQSGDISEEGNLAYRTIKVDSLPAGQYTMTIFGIASPRYIRYKYTANGETTVAQLSADATSRSFTFETDVTNFCVSFRKTDSSEITETVTVQIESGGSSTSFEPYANICPITGWTGIDITSVGENLWGGEKLRDDIKSALPGATIDTANEEISFSAGATVNHYFIVSKEYMPRNAYAIPFKDNTPYTLILSGKNTGSTSKATNVRIAFEDGTGATLSFSANNTYEKIYYNVPANKKIAHIMKTNIGGATTLKYNECGLFEGTLTADDFITYQNGVKTVTFPTPPGTVYGGTLTVNKDGTGTLVIENVSEKISDMSWSITGANFGATPTYSTDRNTLISEIYKTKSSASGLVSGEIAFTNGGALRICDNRYETAEAFSTAEGERKIVYSLATPITYTLPAPVIRSLLGTNNVWADTGNVLHLDYTADTKSYIDNLFASLTNATGVSF